MAKKNNKTKAVALSALLASTATAAVVYANKEAKNTEENTEITKLLVDRVDKDTVKVSIENVNSAAKAYQLSLKIDGDVEFKKDASSIKWSTGAGTEKVENDSTVIDYVIGDDNKTIDIFVASDSELQRNGSVIDVMEIDLNKPANADVDYNIIPDIKEGDISFKSVDTNNKSLELAEMAYDDKVLKFNTPAVIELIRRKAEPREGEIEESVIEDVYPVIDNENNTIKIKEGFEFKAKEFVAITDEEDGVIDSNNLVVTDDEGNIIEDSKNDFKTGTYAINYTVADSAGEETTFDINLVVEPNVWNTKPQITGVPKSLTIYTGDIFDIYSPTSDDKGKPVPVIATDSGGNNVEVVVSGDFDLTQAGTYLIRYTAKDRFDNISEETLELIVELNEMPVVIIPEGETIINRGTPFNAKDGVSAIDDNEAIAIENIMVTGTVNTNIAGKYTISYEVADNRSDQKTKVSRVIIVNGEPSIYGDLDTIMIKKGTTLTDEQILNGVIVEDDLDENVKLSVNRNGLDTNTDGTYKVLISATDTRGLTKTVEKIVIVNSKSTVDMPDSGDGLSESTPIKKKVIDESAIKIINEELDSLNLSNEININKQILGDAIYNIQITPNQVAFTSKSSTRFVQIVVPKDIDTSTEGIKLTEKESVLVESVKILEGSLKIDAEEIKELTTEILPGEAENKELLWQSSDNSVVKIIPKDNGTATITALKEGTSTIRVMATDNSGKYDSIVVTVGKQKENQAPVLEYKGKTEIILANGMLFDIPVVTASDDRDTDIEVISKLTDSKGTEVTVTDGKLDTTKAGVYTITYTAKDSKGLEANPLEIKVKVKDSIDGVVTGNGNATSVEYALGFEATTEDGLNNLLNAIGKDYNSTLTGNILIDEINNKAIYTIEISEKQGILSRLFTNKSEEKYYIKVTVENKQILTDILNKFLGIENPPTDAEIKVSDITIKVSESEIKVGDKMTVTATVNPTDATNGTLAWTSSNNDLVKITPSKDTLSIELEARKEGSVTIQASSTDGSEINQSIILTIKGEEQEPTVDKEAPLISYAGKETIHLANGMEFTVPKATAVDNVDGKVIVKTTIKDKSGNTLTDIDTTKAGTYTIIYTATDKVENKSELKVTVIVKEAIEGVIIGSGNAQTQESALEFVVFTEYGLKNLVSQITKDYNATLVRDILVDKDNNEVTYIMEIVEKQNMFSKLFGNKTQEKYYIKVTVKNDPSFTEVLNGLLGLTNQENPEIENPDGGTTKPDGGTTKPENTETENPSTGDTGILGYIALGIASITGIAMTTLRKKK